MASAIAGLIERAERRGLVTRIRNTEDERAVEVFMTSAGHELAETVQTEVRIAPAPMIGRSDPQPPRNDAETN